MQSADMSRRGFLATVGAAGAGATVAGRGQVSPIGTARGIAVTTAVGIAAGGAAVGYLAKEGYDAVTGDNKDYSGYTGGDALKSSIEEGAHQMKSTNERVLTSINNNIENSQNIALAKGKAAVIEKMNAGESESQAQTAMENAIDGYYATIQQNLLNHWHSHLDQFAHYCESVQNHADLTLDNILTVAKGGITSFTIDTVSIDLLNGETVDYRWFNSETPYSPSKVCEPLGAADTSKNRSWFGMNGSDGHFYIWGPSIANQTRDPVEDGDVWNALLWERDDVHSALSGFVTDVYANWDAGEIPTEELVDPITAATELEQNYDGYQTQGAMAAMLGIPSSAEQSLYLHLKNDDKYVWADIYTEHVPTSDGKEVGFEVGKSYSPSSWSEPLYIAYEFTDDDGNTTTDFSQIEQDFSIEEGENENGKEIEKFETRSQNTQTSDVSKIEEELDQIREYQMEMQEEAQSGGGGGGGSGIDLSGLSIGPVPGTVVAVGLSLAGIGTVGWLSK